MEQLDSILNKFDKQDFMGLNDFVWWYGVVEDRKDPLYLGRVKVRCIGFHTDDKELIPTDDLPWAQVIQPVTSASISGIGTTPTGLVEGTHVFGFFRDGREGQEPVVLGSAPGIPATIANPDRGFFDGRTFEERANSPYPPLFIERYDDGKPAQVIDGHRFPDSENSSYTFDGVGDLNGSKMSFYVDQTTQKVLATVTKKVAGPAGSQIDEYVTSKQVFSRHPDENRMYFNNGELILSLPSTNFLATGKIKFNRNNPDESTPEPYSQIFLATHRLTQSIKNGATTIHAEIPRASNESLKFEQPVTEDDSEYPFNHVTYSESGHLFQMDDTPRKERLRIMHRSQSFIDFTSNGFRVDNTVGELHSYVDSHSFSHIVGDDVKTVGGSFELFAGSRGSSDSTIRVGAGGNLDIIADEGNITLDAKGSGKVVIKGGNFSLENNRSDNTENRSFLLSGSNVRVEKANESYFDTKTFIVENAGAFNVESKAASIIGQGAVSLNSTSGSIIMNSLLSSVETITGTPLLDSKIIRSLTGNILVEATLPTDSIKLHSGPLGAGANFMMSQSGFTMLTAKGDFGIYAPAGSYTHLTQNGTSITDAKEVSIKNAAGGTFAMNPSGILDIKSASRSLKQILDSLIDAILQLSVPTGTGPSGTAINNAQFTKIKEELKLLLQ